MMARLLRGENDKIDRINDLVESIQLIQDKESMTELLEMFHPMILAVCTKWSKYFNDEYHKLKPLNELISDAQLWFMQYTIYKYTIDGPATYNKFILDHISQRVRYIYECELKYYSENIFPDPNKNNEDDCEDMLETVAYKYKSEHNNLEDDILDGIDHDNRTKLAHAILAMMDDTTIFNPREKTIFTEISYNGVTHEKMGEILDISRTRVSQILRKTKNKLYKLIEMDEEIWKLLNNTDIEFEER